MEHTRLNKTIYKGLYQIDPGYLEEYFYIQEEMLLDGVYFEKNVIASEGELDTEVFSVIVGKKDYVGQYEMYYGRRLTTAQELTVIKQVFGWYKATSIDDFERILEETFVQHSNTEMQSKTVNKEAMLKKHANIMRHLTNEVDKLKTKD